MTTTKQKWFFAAQKISEKWLLENYENYSCNWQVVQPDIVIESFTANPGLNQIIFCYYKTGIITRFRGDNWSRKFFNN